MSSLPHHFSLRFVPSPESRHCNPGFRISCCRTTVGAKDPRKSRSIENGRAEKSGLSPPQSSSTEFISSLSNPFVKHCVKLRQNSSYRRSCGLALVVGITPIREIASREEGNGSHYGNNPPLIDQLLLLDESEAVSSTSAAFFRKGSINGGFLDGAQVIRVNSTVMKKISGLQSTDSTEAVAVMKIPFSFLDLGVVPSEFVDFGRIFSSPPRRILVLDGIQDPGNVGTLLRSAMAFKWVRFT